MNRLKITMTKKQKTMKKHLFKTRLLSFAALCGIALTFAACAKEDVVQNTTGTEGDNDKNLTTFVAGDEAKLAPHWIIIAATSIGKQVTIST